MPIPTRAADTDYHYYAYRYDGDAGAAPWALSVPQPKRSGYQFYSMRRNLAGLAAEGATKLVPNIHLQQLGLPCAAQDDPANNNYYVQALSFGGNANAPIVLITGGIHAREWIAPAMAYLLAEYLIRNYTTTPAGDYQIAIRDLVDTRQIYIVPMLNPVGNWYTVFSTNPGTPRNWRKNRRRFPVTLPQWIKKKRSSPADSNRQYGQSRLV